MRVIVILKRDTLAQSMNMNNEYFYDEAAAAFSVFAFTAVYNQRSIEYYNYAQHANNIFTTMRNIYF